MIPVCVDSSARIGGEELTNLNLVTDASVLDELELIVKVEHNRMVFDPELGEEREGIHYLGLATRHRILTEKLNTPAYKEVELAFDQLKESSQREYLSLAKGMASVVFATKVDLNVELDVMPRREMEHLAYKMIAVKAMYKAKIQSLGLNLFIDDLRQPPKVSMKVLSTLPREGVITLTPHSIESLQSDYDFGGEFARLNEKVPWLKERIVDYEHASRILTYFKEHPNSVLRAGKNRKDLFSKNYAILLLKKTIVDYIGSLTFSGEIDTSSSFSEQGQKLRNGILTLHKSRFDVRRVSNLYDQGRIEQMLDVYMNQIEANWQNLPSLMDHYTNTVERYARIMTAVQPLQRYKRAIIVGSDPDLEFFLTGLYPELKRQAKGASFNVGGRKPRWIDGSKFMPKELAYFREMSQTEH